MKKTSETELLAQMSQIRYIMAMRDRDLSMTVTQLTELSSFPRDHVEWAIAKLVNDKKVIRIQGERRQEAYYKINYDLVREDAWMHNHRSFRMTKNPLRRQTECSRCGAVVPGGRHGRGRRGHLPEYCDEMMIRNIIEK